MLVDAAWQTRIEAAHYLFIFFFQCKVKDEGHKNLETCIRRLTHWQVMGFFQAGRKTDLKAAIPVIFSGTNIAVTLCISQDVLKKPVSQVYLPQSEEEGKGVKEQSLYGQS